MFLSILTLLTALSISAVAIYYSVAGLAAIFAAATIPIIIMGGVLEISKLVTAVWLHKYWSKAVWWLRAYLSTAVIVLMLITSMGIFGFLSKAHIEQTSASQESVARVQQLEKEITRQQEIISRAENQIKKLETSGTGNDAQIQSQIDKEQERIDNAYKRIQPAIDEQNRIIGSQAKLYQDELTRIDEQLATLQRYIDAGDKESIKKAQAMIGAAQDGAWGSRTSAKADEWKTARRAQRTDLLTKIEQATNNPQARAAANEIKRLRQGVERDIAESNKLINRLRAQIGKTDKTASIDKEVDEQNEKIKVANNEVDRLTQEKYQLEGEYRKLEAEVGPVKYIAEFIYGERADTNMLEEAVRWVIVIIIFVFDPLAVLLLIASQYSFNWLRDEKERKNELVQEETPQDDTQDTPPPLQNESNDTEVVGGDEREVEEFINRSNEELFRQIEEDEKLAQERVMTPEEEAELEKSALEEWNKMIEEAERAVEDEDDESEIENAHPSIKSAMRRWKAENPGKPLKKQRRMFEQGKIDKLPWIDYVEDQDALEAAKWAHENQNTQEAEEAKEWADEKIEESKKKTVSWIEKDGAIQLKKTKEQ